MFISFNTFNISSSLNLFKGSKLYLIDPLNIKTSCGIIVKFLLNSIKFKSDISILSMIILLTSINDLNIDFY